MRTNISMIMVYCKYFHFFGLLQEALEIFVGKIGSDNVCTLVADRLSEFGDNGALTVTDTGIEI